MQAIGFSLYMEMLERAVRAIRAGEAPDLDQPLATGVEVDLHLPALIPDDYLPDVHMRLVLYKRIANCGDDEALEALRVENDRPLRSAARTREGAVQDHRAQIEG